MSLTREQFVKYLADNDACEASMKWINERPTMSPEELYATCDKIDWLGWLAEPLVGASLPITGVEVKEGCCKACDHTRDRLTLVATEMGISLDDFVSQIEADQFRAQLTWAELEAAILKDIEARSGTVEMSKTDFVSLIETLLVDGLKAS